ncbi:MAG: hypothetical protein WC874_01780 [Candidatus Izemoplasmatales bacterium]
MLNQRGQAFSVFELMIAAIIAVAILFVLLPIINNLITPSGSARDNIANTLNAVKNGGAQTSQEFVLKKDDTLTSKQFSKEGFDQHSIIFETSSSLAGNNLIYLPPSSAEEAFSQFIYKGATQLKAKASVYCEATGQSLADTIGPLELDISGEADMEICGLDGEYQPCCLVVIKRA